MKDTQLYLVIGTLACIDLIVMTAWQVFDPFYRETKELAPYVSFYPCIYDPYDKLEKGGIKISMHIFYVYNLRLHLPILVGT